MASSKNSVSGLHTVLFRCSSTLEECDIGHSLVDLNKSWRRDNEKGKPSQSLREWWDEAGVLPENCLYFVDLIPDDDPLRPYRKVRICLSASELSDWWAAFEDSPASRVLRLPFGEKSGIGCWFDDQAWACIQSPSQAPREAVNQEDDDWLHWLPSSIWPLLGDAQSHAPWTQFSRFSDNYTSTSTCESIIHQMVEWIGVIRSHRPRQTDLIMLLHWRCNFQYKCLRSGRADRPSDDEGNDDDDDLPSLIANDPGCAIWKDSQTHPAPWALWWGFYPCRVQWVLVNHQSPPDHLPLDFHWSLFDVELAILGLLNLLPPSDSLAAKLQPFFARAHQLNPPPDSVQWFTHLASLVLRCPHLSCDSRCFFFSRLSHAGLLHGHEWFVADVSPDDPLASAVVDSYDWNSITSSLRSLHAIESKSFICLAETRICGVLYRLPIDLVSAALLLISDGLKSLIDSQEMDFLSINRVFGFLSELAFFRLSPNAYRNSVWPRVRTVTAQTTKTLRQSSCSRKLKFESIIAK